MRASTSSSGRLLSGGAGVIAITFFVAVASLFVVGNSAVSAKMLFAGK